MSVGKRRNSREKIGVLFYIVEHGKKSGLASCFTICGEIINVDGPVREERQGFFNEFVDAWIWFHEPDLMGVDALIKEFKNRIGFFEKGNVDSIRIREEKESFAFAFLALMNSTMGRLRSKMSAKVDSKKAASPVNPIRAEADAMNSAGEIAPSSNSIKSGATRGSESSADTLENNSSFRVALRKSKRRMTFPISKR